MSRPLFLIFGIATLTAGCVDYQEDFAIRSNGSGSIRSVISVHRMLDQDGGQKLKADLEALTNSAPGLILEHYETFKNEEKERVMDFKISFDDVKDLRGALSGGGADIARFFGSFEAENQEDRFVMTRTINFSEAEAMNPVVKTLGKMSADRRLTYRMTFPFEILSSNSTSIDPETTTATWEVPLAKALEGPVTMTAEIRKPKIARVRDRLGPFGFWLAAGLLVTGLLTGLGFFIRRRNRSVSD